MADDGLTSYILNAREKGRSREQITKALYSVGWKKEKVDAAFQKLDGAGTWQQPAAQPQQPRPVQPSQPPVRQPAASPVPSQQRPATPLQSPMPVQPQPGKAGQEQPQIRPPEQAQQAGVQPAPSAKKSLFAFPQIFGKKKVQPAPFASSQPAPAGQPGQPSAQPAVQAPQQPRPGLHLPQLFHPKPQQPQPDSGAASQKAPEMAQPAQPAQSAIVPPPKQAAARQPAAEPTQPSIQQPRASQPSRPPSQQAPPFILPPVTSFTVSTQAVKLDTSQVATFVKTEQARNPAFSNLSAAAVASSARKNKLPLLAILAVLLLSAAYLYFNQPQAPQAPVVVGPHINLTQLAQQDKSATKQPVQQYVQKKNTTPANPNSSLPLENGSGVLGNKSTPSNATPTQPKQNGSGAPGGGAGQFVRFSSFLSSEGVPLEQFCQNMGGGLYHVDYTEYSGMDCRSYDGMQNYSLPADFPPTCSSVPCCYNAPSKQFSRLYVSFECGLYS